MATRERKKNIYLKVSAQVSGIVATCEKFPIPVSGAPYVSGSSFAC